MQGPTRLQYRCSLNLFSFEKRKWGFSAAVAGGPDFEADQCSEPRPGCTKKAIVQEQEMTNPSGRRRLEGHLPASLRGESRRRGVRGIRALRSRR